MKDLCKNLLRVFSLAMLLLVATSARAGVVDLGELVPGETVTLAGGMHDYVATYTATISGTIYCDSPSGDHFIPYYDADHTQAVEITEGNQVGNIWPYSFKAEAGTTYYFFASWVFDSGEFTLYTSRSLDISSNTYPSNSTFSAAGDSQIDITFTSAVTVDAVTISTGSVTEGVTNYRTTGSYLMIGISDILKKWYANGTIKAEQKFVVKVTGVRATADATNLYNGDGVLELTYYAANAPIEMTAAQSSDGSVTLVNGAVSSTNFLSYFTESNPVGKYVFTFSQPLDPTKGEVKLIYGNQEGDDGEYYVETLTPSFSDDYKTMTVDFSGKLRRAKDMVTSATNYGQITLGLTHLMGADGQYVYTDTQGGLGSFYFTFGYSEVTADIAAEWDPEESLAEADSLEIYVTNYSALEYDGIKFAWTVSGEETSVVVAKADLQITPDEYGGATIVVAVPAAAKTQSDVTVSFNNAVTADGVDHSSVLSQVFNATMKILSSVPAAGAELASIAAGSTVGVTLDRSDLGYVQYEIWDLNPTDPDDACVSSRATLHAVDGQEGVYTAERYGADLTLVKGHTYRFDVYGWLTETDARGTGYYNPAARASFTFSGTTEPFTFSDVKFVSVSPADGYVLPSADYNEVTLTFDGLVKLDSDKTFINLGMGATKKFESITPVDGVGEYAKVWTLTMSKSFLESQTNSVTLAVVAYDVNDKLVEGNEGTDANSYFKFEYQIDFNNPDIYFTPESGSTVTSISSILAASPIGIGRSWDTSAGDITVYKGQNFICKVPSDNIVDGDTEQQTDGSKLVVNMNINLPEAITEAGTYQIFIPRGFFILGEEFTAYKNKEYMLSYTIEGEVAPTPDFNVVSVPANGAKVDSCDEITLTFSDYATASLGGGKALLTKKGSDTITQLGDAQPDWNVYNKVIQPLGGNAAENGTYTVTFPAGYFLLGLSEEDDNPSDSPEFTITFTVGEESETPEVNTINVISVPADGSTVASCSQLYLTFPDYESVAEASGKATISRDGGTPVALGSTEWGVEWNEIIQPLGYEATKNGSYIVTFPAGYFQLAKTGQEDAYSPEFTISFTVGEENNESGLTYTVSPDPEDGALEELKSFTLTFNENISSFYYGNISKIGVSHNSQITYFDISNDSYSYEGKSVTFTFANAFTEEGNYIINIPESTIFFGDFGDIENEEIYVKYEVGKTVVVGPTLNIVSVPENGSTVESCDSIDIIFSDYEEAGIGGGKATISKDGGEAVALGDAELGIDWNEVIQPLGTAAAEDGTYVVTFPAGYFILDDVDAPEFTITFTVGTANGVRSISIDDENARYINLQGVVVKNPTPGIYILNGKKVVVANAK
jgi:hypothetical protein